MKKTKKEFYILFSNRGEDKTIESVFARLCESHGRSLAQVQHGLLKRFKFQPFIKINRKLAVKLMQVGLTVYQVENGKILNSRLI